MRHSSTRLCPRYWHHAIIVKLSSIFFFPFGCSHACSNILPSKWIGYLDHIIDEIPLSICRYLKPRLLLVMTVSPPMGVLDIESDTIKQKVQ